MKSACYPDEDVPLTGIVGVAGSVSATPVVMLLAEDATVVFITVGIDAVAFELTDAVVVAARAWVVT